MIHTSISYNRPAGQSALGGISVCARVDSQEWKGNMYISSAINHMDELNKPAHPVGLIGFIGTSDAYESLNQKGDTRSA